MKWKHPAVGLIVILLVVLFAGPAAADIYRWKDKNGIWHFSDGQPPADDQTVERFQKSAGEAPKSPVNRNPYSEPPPAAESVSSQGMLWRVKYHNNSAPSYILGTIHSEDPRVLNFSAAVEKAFGQADTFVMEAVLDEAALLRMTTAMIYLDGRQLRSVIGQPLYERVKEATAAYGLPEMAIIKMKPWAILSLLSVPKPKTGQFMDIVLYRRAKQAGKAIYGLESVDEQLDVFENIPLENQIQMLSELMDQRDKLPQMFEQLINTYLKGNIDEVARLAKSFMLGEHPKVSERFLKRLNDDRNVKMVQRVQPYLKNGNAFVAVGALHLPGEKGILKQLRSMGYQVEPLP